jgi:hypothetical protein
MDSRGHSLRSAWLRRTEEQLNPRDGIPASVKHHAPLANWEKLRMPPDGRAERQLYLALYVAPVHYDHPLVRICLQRCMEVVGAAEHDDRWDTWWSNNRIGSYGRLRAVKTFASAWLSDGELDLESLNTASEEERFGALHERPVWTELPQCEYLDGAQLLLITGNLQRAREALNIKKKFLRVRQYYEWTVRFLDLVDRPEPDRDALIDHLDPYFDLVRDPYFNGETGEEGGSHFSLPLLRLRLALMRWIYIERQPIAGNWRHVIEQIGY